MDRHYFVGKKRYIFEITDDYIKLKHQDLHIGKSKIKDRSHEEVMKEIVKNCLKRCPKRSDIYESLVILYTLILIDKNLELRGDSDV
jgi:hypothetical protein